MGYMTMMTVRHPLIEGDSAGAPYMSGHISGVSGHFWKTIHMPFTFIALNIVTLSTSSKIPDIHCMIENLKALGVFFDWPRHSRWFENIGADINQNRPLDQKIKKEKIKPLCETRWIERHTSIENFSQLYEPICITLKDIAANRQSWDAKSMTESSGHLNTITSPGFIVAFMVNKYIMG